MIRSTRCAQNIRRQGHSLLIVVIVLMLVSAITVTLVTASLANYQQAAHRHMRAQADCLAESALLRAQAALQSNAEYTGEVWRPELTNSDLGPAEVLIQITSETISIQAILPSDVPVHEQVRAYLETPR